MITQERLKELLRYCPETGIFTWLHNRRGSAGKGAEAGSVHRNPSGKSYRLLRVCNRLYLTHRLAFLYMLGEFPKDEVDHEDGNGCNNIWTNLRAVTSSTNHKNKRKPTTNTSGTVGVCWYKQTRKWHVKIGHGGRSKSIGYFHDKEDAIAARKAAEVLYGFHENHGTERPL